MFFVKIENVKVHDIEESFKASKYPMAVDTYSCDENITDTIKRLASASGGHDQFLTGIIVSFDLTCSNKMWVEAERYRFLSFVSSQSTMHRITKFNIKEQYNDYVDPRIVEIMVEKINDYNSLIKTHGAVNDEEVKRKYLEILYSNPAGFELTARLTTNYRCLKNVYFQRRNHRLPEWREFCKWIEKLPYFKELILGDKDNGI